MDTLMVGDQADGTSRLPSTRPKGPIIDTIESTAPVAAAPVSPDRRPARPRGQVEQFGDGRVCGATGCVTILSRYNRDGLCWRDEQSRRAAEDAARG